LSPSEQRWVLLHELMHLKRDDLWLNALSCVLMALHWFNPVLWVAFSRSRLDRELACDQAVLASATNTIKRDYGHTLLKVQMICGQRGLGLGFMGLFARGNSLRTRIQFIAQPARPRLLMRILYLTLITVMTFVGTTSAKPTEAVKATPSAAMVKVKTDEVAYNFTNSPLPDVLRRIAADAGIMSLVMPEKVVSAPRSITFAMQGKPLFVLESLCRANGLDLTFDRAGCTLRTADDVELVVKSYSLPVTGLQDSDGKVATDLRAILDQHAVAVAPPADMKPQVQWDAAQKRFIVIATQLQHGWVQGYLTGLAGKPAVPGDLPSDVNLKPNAPLDTIVDKGLPVITSVKDLPKEETKVHFVLPLRHISPEQAMKAFCTVIKLHDYGSIVTVDESSSVIITENTATIRSILDIASKIDLPRAMIPR
jgi:BlaR1 peptidase M56